MHPRREPRPLVQRGDDVEDVQAVVVKKDGVSAVRGDARLVVKDDELHEDVGGGRLRQAATPAPNFGRRRPVSGAFPGADPGADPGAVFDPDGSVEAIGRGVVDDAKRAALIGASHVPSERLRARPNFVGGVCASEGDDGCVEGSVGAFGACGACAGGTHVGEMPVRGLEGEATALQRVAEDFAPDAVADADGDDAGRVPGEAAAVVAVAAEVGVGRGARLARQARSVRVPRGVGIAQQELVALELEAVVHAEGAHGDREARRMASVAVTPVDVEGGRQLVAIER